MTVKEHLFGESEEIDKLGVVSKRSKYRVIQTVLAHPKNAPSERELKFANPDIQSGIRDHVEDLIEINILEKIKLEQKKDLPYVFYTITDEGKQFLDEHGILPNEHMLEEIYKNVEKPDRIQKYEQAPRGDAEFEEKDQSRTKPTT